MGEELFAPAIIDNTPGRKLIDVIRNQLKKSKKAKFAIGYFFLTGFNLVNEDFPENIEEKPFLKIVMGNETTLPTKEELAAGYNLRELLKRYMIEELQKTELSEEQKNRIKRLRDLVAENVIDVRLYDRSRLHAKLYLFITNPEEIYGSPGLAIVGSSNFTAEGLTQNRELNVLLSSRENVVYLEKWFDSLWEEASEFREDLLKVIDYSGVLPESPYPRIGKFVDPVTLFKYLVYNWFEGRIHSLVEKDILMEFQIVGVLNAVNILNFYNGVILADSVGLGKSFMAAEIVEELLYGKHSSWVPEGKIPGIMLILPPSIIPQWEDLLIGGKSKNGSQFLRNNLKKSVIERENYKIYEVYSENGEKLIGKIAFLSLGLFQNMKEHELERVAEDYDLFIIDEAHKYRNKNTNRWNNARRLQKKSNGFSNKYILLTATPLNNSIIDIYNLIRIFVDDTFVPFRRKHNKDITKLIAKYRKYKKELEKENDATKRKILKETAAEIKKYILDEIMVLRTRKYIMEQFKDLKINGRPLVFKDPKPYSLDYSPFYTSEYLQFLNFLNRTLESISFEHTKLYGTRYVVFEEESLEEGEDKRHYVEIADLFRLLLGKRLESGIYAFETTLRRIYEKEKIFYDIFKAKMNAILDKESLKAVIEEAMDKAKIKKDLEAISEEFGAEEAKDTGLDRVVKILAEYAEELKENDKMYTESEILRLGLKKALKKIEHDLRVMDEILQKLDDLKEKEHGMNRILGRIPKDEDIIELSIFCYRNDPKLEALKQIMGPLSVRSKKLEDAPSLYRRRVVIFTQYKDTAYYLYHNLLDWVKNNPDLHTWLRSTSGSIEIGLVTGDTDTQTKINYIKRFAPRANNGYSEVEKFGEIKILISTDALSEGVNLQDADAVVNYDLPWNPMTIVQRVGRVNRIGSDKDIDVVNFIPSREIELLVGIITKLKEKIEDITLVVGKDTKILSPDEEISVETFGQKIKDISRLSMTELEQYGMSEDFMQLIPGGIPKEQLDEYMLLNIVQYELGYTSEDFKDVANMPRGPYYTCLRSENEKIFSIYEFYRGNYRIIKKVLSLDPQSGKVNDESPLVFLNLIRKAKSDPVKIEEAIEGLKKLEEKANEEVNRLKKEYTVTQIGFLGALCNALLREREKMKNNDKYIMVLATLPTIPSNPYSREIKQRLTQKGLIEMNREEVVIKNVERTVNELLNIFRDYGLSEISSLKVQLNHVGWWYEI